jgi:ketosteroid isomerase-like protein
MATEEHPNVALVREGMDAMARGDMDWMSEHIADDVVWHVGGNSRWAGEYRGRQQVFDLFERQGRAMGGMPDTEVHDVLGNDDHVVVLGTASARGPDGTSAQWQYAQVMHVRDGKATEVWGLSPNDAEVDPFLDGLPDA